jgi:hypothetical protein
MRLRHVVPFLLLFAWQATPPTESRDRPSRLRLWLGRGTSSYDYAYWGTGGGQCLAWEEPRTCCSDCGCYCNCLRYAPTYPERREAKDKTSTAGIQVDAWPSPAMRVSAAYGSAYQTDPLGTGSLPEFAGGLVAWEGRHAGLGGGWANGPAQPGYHGLAAYARLGSLDGPQFRADLRAPTATPGATGWVRAGFAYNQQGRRENIAAFLGISAVEAGPDTAYPTDRGSALAVTRPAFFADVALPLGRHLDLFGRGHFAKKARGLGFGLALRLGP